MKYNPWFPIADPGSAMVGNVRVRENQICLIFSNRYKRLEALARTRDKAIIRRGQEHGFFLKLWERLLFQTIWQIQ